MVSGTISLSAAAEKASLCEAPGTRAGLPYEIVAQMRESLPVEDRTSWPRIKIGQNARVSACHAGLGNHTAAHERGLVDILEGTLEPLSHAISYTVHTSRYGTHYPSSKTKDEVEAQPSAWQTAPVRSKEEEEE